MAWCCLCTSRYCRPGTSSQRGNLRTLGCVADVDRERQVSGYAKGVSIGLLNSDVGPVVKKDTVAGKQPRSCHPMVELQARILVN